MNSKNYTREIIAANSPIAAYRALTSEFNKWWTPCSSPISALGDLVTFRFDPTYWTMRVTDLLPEKYVELECMDAYHIHEGLPESILKEWEGTKLKWKIEPQKNNVKITFEHEGLNPSLDCYDICEAGWDYFFVDSLKNYLDTGKGLPSVIEKH